MPSTGRGDGILGLDLESCDCPLRSTRTATLLALGLRLGHGVRLAAELDGVALGDV
jgi:hypothetical protein